jgi:hypothetical protein
MAGMVLLNDGSLVLTMMVVHGNDWRGLQQTWSNFGLFPVHLIEASIVLRVVCRWQSHSSPSR